MNPIQMIIEELQNLEKQEAAVAAQLHQIAGAKMACQHLLAKLSSPQVPDAIRERMAGNNGEVLNEAKTGN